MKPTITKIHPQIEVKKYENRYVFEVVTHEGNATTTESIPVLDDTRELDMQYINTLKNAEIRDTILNYLKEKENA